MENATKPEPLKANTVSTSRNVEGSIRADKKKRMIEFVSAGIVTLAVLLAGIGIGYSLIPENRIMDSERVIEVAVTPQSCLDALDYSEQIRMAMMEGQKVSEMQNLIDAYNEYLQNCHSNL